MRILNPEVLRVTYVYQAFRNCAESFRPRARKLYHYSRQSDKIATFWSHSWHGSRWQKISTLFLLYNGWVSVVFGTLAALLMSALFACGILPGFTRLAIFPEIPFSIWGLTTGILVTLLLFCFWRPKQEVFFDRICIHPENEVLKLDAIFSLAGILKESKEMLVLWDQSWSSRLWCLFEMAAFLKSTVDSDSKGGGARMLMVRPTWVGSCSIVAFLTLWINTFAFTTLPVSGSGGTDVLISLVGCMVIASVLGLSIVVAFRSYFRSVTLLEEKLQRTSFDTVRSVCCECGHSDAFGNTLVCDREALKQCVALWFGSLEAFEEYIRSKVCDAVVHDLRSKVFTKTWTLQVSTPVLWGFMDLVATFIRIGWWDVVWDLSITGLVLWLFFGPTFFQVVFCLTQRYCKRHTGGGWIMREVFLSLALLFVNLLVLLVPCVIFAMTRMLVTSGDLVVPVVRPLIFSASLIFYCGMLFAAMHCFSGKHRASMRTPAKPNFHRELDGGHTCLQQSENRK